MNQSSPPSLHQPLGNRLPPGVAGAGQARRQGSDLRAQACSALVYRPTILVPARGAYLPLELWHLLSLDAPSVAVLWTLLLAQCTGVELGWRLPAALFLAVWILYAGDRLLDARGGSVAVEHGELLERHLFHARHRSAFLSGIFIGAVVLAVLLLRKKELLALYAVPGALLAGWLTLVHGGQLQGRKALPKELAVAVFFPAAVFWPSLFLMHNGPASTAHRWELAPFAFLFSAVCALNCFFLYAWENDQRNAGPPHRSTQWGLRHLDSLAVGTVAAGLLGSLAGASNIALGAELWVLHRGATSLSRFGLACSLAAYSLLLLDRYRQRLEPLALRAAADAALLTPVLFLHLRG